MLKCANWLHYIYNMLNCDKLRMAILDSKIHKSHLCQELGFARSTIDKILNGEDTKISTLEAIAKRLNLSMGYLFDENESVTTNTVQESTKSTLSIDGKYPEAALQTIDKLTTEIELLKKLLERTEKQLEEKERFITHLLETKN